MEETMNEQIDILETVESLQAAHERLFPAASKHHENDSYSLAQPYLWRSVPTFASDKTESKAPF